MSFPKYEKYKDSGVEWIGPVPKHWDQKWLSLLAEESNHSFVDGPFGSDLKTGDYLDSGIPLIQLNNIRDGKHLLSNLKFISKSKRDQLLRHTTKDGDVVIAKMADPVARAAVVSDVFPEYVIVADCVKMTPNLELVDLNFLIWSVNSDSVRISAELASSGTTRIRINLGQIKKLKIPYPSLSEQTQIAHFLDYETARIDALIAEQERLIALLKEKRQAVISHAVTKGCDRAVPMKDSGVEWLGEVPEHWKITKLKHAIDEYGGSTPSKENLDYWNGEIPWVTPKDMKREVIGDSIDHVSTLAIEETNLSILPKQVVLIVVRGMILAHSVPVAITTTNTTINQDMKAMRAKKKLSSDYLLLLLQGMKNAVFSFVDNSAHGTKKIEWERFENISIPVPEPQEQTEIVLKTRENIRKVDLLYAEVNRSIGTLNERRSALISAAVTGKIDVRNWQPPTSTSPMPTLEAVHS